MDQIRRDELLFEVLPYAVKSALRSKHKIAVQMIGEDDLPGELWVVLAKAFPTFDEHYETLRSWAIRRTIGFLNHREDYLRNTGRTATHTVTIPFRKLIRVQDRRKSPDLIGSVVSSLIESLPESRKICVQDWLSGSTCRQIGERLGISHARVSQLIHDAVKTIRLFVAGTPKNKPISLRLLNYQKKSGMRWKVKGMRPVETVSRAER